MAWQDALWKRVVGNELVKEMLASDLASGRLAHAYLVEGADGSGRTTLAKTVCAVMSGDPTMADRIYGEICPDISYLRRKDDKKTIGVDEVRAIRSSAYIRPGDLDFKAYLFEEADAMTVQAQNALLKLLEEPPAEVYFFLMCENASALLPTVRSRAPTLRMQPVPKEQMAEYLRSTDRRARELSVKNPDAFDALIENSGGRIGRALHLLDGRSAGKSGELYDAVLGFVEVIASKNVRDIYLSCLNLPAKRDELSEFYRRTLEILRDLTVLRIGSDADLVSRGNDGARLCELSGRFSQGRLLCLCELLLLQCEQLKSNVNLQNSKISLASAITQIR